MLISIDNGTTGTIAIFDDSQNLLTFQKMPVRKCKNYQKVSQNISRIEVKKLSQLIVKYIGNENTDTNATTATNAIIERPMINPQRFKASISASRALEAVLIVLEGQSIPYTFVDSKEWQKPLFEGMEEKDTKLNSLQKGCELFPAYSAIIEKHGDADSALMGYHFLS